MSLAVTLRMFSFVTLPHHRMLIIRSVCGVQARTTISELGYVILSLELLFGYCCPVEYLSCHIYGSIDRVSVVVAPAKVPHAVILY
jgi:hypothetical protein